MVKSDSKNVDSKKLLSSPHRNHLPNSIIPTNKLLDSKPQKTTGAGNVMMSNEVKKWLDALCEPLTSSEVERWIASKNRSAASLLTPGRMLMPKMGNYLEEALERYPNDPEVLQAAILSGFTPAGRDQMLETLKRVAPDQYKTLMLDALSSAKAKDAPALLDILHKTNKNEALEINFSGYKSMISDLLIYSGRDEVASAAWAEFGMDNLSLISNLSHLRELASGFDGNLSVQAGVVGLLQDLGAAHDVPLEVITYALMNERTLSNGFGSKPQEASLNLGIPHLEYQSELDSEIERNQTLMDFYVNLGQNLPAEEPERLALFFAEVQRRGVSSAIFNINQN